MIQGFEYDLQWEETIQQHPYGRMLEYKSHSIFSVLSPENGWSEIFKALKDELLKNPEIRFTNCSCRKKEMLIDPSQIF